MNETHLNLEIFQMGALELVSLLKRILKRMFKVFCRVHFQGFRQRGRALVADGIVFQVEPYVSAEIDFRKVLAPHALPRAGTVWATLGSPRALSRGSRPRSTPKL